jgi:XTP/dITP diphosphohydrolase
VIPRLVIASKNPDKVAEMESVLGELGLVDEVARGLDWPDVEETGETLEENALLKAREVAHATGLPAMADDTGLEVAALNGLPGVATARFAGPDASYQDNMTKLLELMDGEVDRWARFRTVVALVDSKGEITGEGVLEGRIAETTRGEGGFGYDPIFQVEGRTLAEMSTAEKNSLSHRARAIRELARRLAER